MVQGREEWGKPARKQTAKGCTYIATLRKQQRTLTVHGEKVNETAARLLPSELQSHRLTRVLVNGWCVNWLDDACFFLFCFFSMAEERGEEADQKSIDKKVDGTQQGKKCVVRSCNDVRGWQVNGRIPFQLWFRRAVAAPASYGCSSDASRSVWQSSSCSSACEC